MIRARHIRVAAVVGVLSIVSAGCIGFEVTKRVVGTSTGPFTVRIECVNSTGTESQDLNFDTFDTNGEQTLSSDYFDLDIETGDTTCTITEPVSAGATSVSIECVNPPVEVTCTPGTGTLTVVAPPADSPEDIFDVSILVTNTFDDTPPPTSPPGGEAPAAVVAQPNTTG